MKRRLFLAVLPGAFLLATGRAHAAPVDDVVAALTSQGFSAFEVTQTLLGRVRILASAGNRQREIIINPNTGEILRDVWLSTRDSDDPRTTTSRPSGGNGDDDDDDDDGDDDDDDGGDDDDDDD